MPDRTPVKNLGAAGLSLAARLYVGGDEVDASGVVANDLGNGDYDFEVPIGQPYSLIVYETADPARALWNFEVPPLPAYRPRPVPIAATTFARGPVRVVLGADCELQLQIQGLDFDPMPWTATLDVYRLGGDGAVLSELSARVEDVAAISGRYSCQVAAPIAGDAWPDGARTGRHFGRFSLALAGAVRVFPADASLQVDVQGVP